MTTTWGALRHECRMCGGSCQSVGVVLLSDVERQRVAAQAETLGVLDPVTAEGQLRRVGGRCVFLDDAGLCRIHGRFGLAEKPHVCRQFPVVATRAEGEVRVGVDPACYTAIRTARTGPRVDDGSLAVSVVALPEALRPIEDRVVTVLRGATRVGAALGTLVGEQTTGDDLPTEVLGRFRSVVADARLAELLDDADTAPILADAIRPIAAAPDVESLRISPEAHAWAIDATARVVWLRLGRPLDHPAVVAVLVLCGASSCASDATDDPTFGWRLAGWIRALRSPIVLGRLFSDPTRLRWLLTGRAT